MRNLQPPSWPRPKGYSNGIEAEGRLIFVAGQVGWDEHERFVATDFAGQFEQVLRNILSVLTEANAGPEHIVRMTWYVTNRQTYLGSLKEIGAVYRALIGRNYPAMAVLVVAGLVEEGALLEIEATAVVPK